MSSHTNRLCSGQAAPPVVACNGTICYTSHHTRGPRSSEAGLPFSSGRKHSIIHAYRFLFHHSTVCCRFAARAFRKGLLLGSLFFTAPSKKAQEGPPPRYTKVFKRCTFTSEKKFAITTAQHRSAITRLDSALKVLTRDDDEVEPSRVGGAWKNIFHVIIKQQILKVFSRVQPPKACTFPQLYKDF